MRHAVKARGVREKGKERGGDVEAAEDNIYLACSKRDSKTTREKERDLCESDMDGTHCTGVEEA